MKLTSILKEIRFPEGNAAMTPAVRMLNMFLNSYSPGLQNFNITNISQIDSIIKKKSKKVFKDNQYELAVMKDNSAYLLNKSTTNSNEYIIGVIAVEKSKWGGISLFNLKQSVGIECYQIHWSNVVEEYMGKGIGKQIYKMVYDWATSDGYALESDRTLFSGSAGMWTKYMPTIASYFGVVLGGLVVPITQEEALQNKEYYFGNYDVQGFVAFEKPPALMRKVLYNIKGLSYAKGDFGIYDTTDQKINDKIDSEGNTFANYVENSENINELIKKLDKSKLFLSNQYVPAFKPSKAKVIFIHFDNAIICVKSTGSKLSFVSI